MRAKKRVSTRDGKEEPSSFIVLQKNSATYRLLRKRGQLALSSSLLIEITDIGKVKIVLQNQNVSCHLLKLEVRGNLLPKQKALFRKVLSPIRQIQRVAEVSVNDMNTRARRVVQNTLPLKWSRFIHNVFPVEVPKMIILMQIQHI